MGATTIFQVGNSGGSGFSVGGAYLLQIRISTPIYPHYEILQTLQVSYVNSSGAIVSGFVPVTYGGPAIESTFVGINPDLENLLIQNFGTTLNIPLVKTNGATTNGATVSCQFADDSLQILKQPLSYYLNLFTSQYKNSPRLNQFAAAVFQPIDDLTNCLAFMNQNFDLNYAFGAQLDVIGQLVGFPRTLPFQPSYSVSPVLDDTTYRLLIQAKIAANNWDGKLVSLPVIWQNLFPGGSMVPLDEQNMTVIFTLNGSFTSLIIDCIAGYAVNGSLSGNMDNGLIVPRPEGVEYQFTFGDLPMFGADLDNTYVAGADLGHAT